MRHVIIPGQRICSASLLSTEMYPEIFREARRLAREKIVDQLNQNGREGETIQWLEGPCFLDKPWPLGPEYGKAFDISPYYRILGTVRIKTKVVP